MIIQLIWYIRFVVFASLVIALVLVALAYGGYKRSRSTSMLFGAVGFGMLGVASLLEGIFFEFLGFQLEQAHALRSTFTALGLLILLYSIYKTR